MAWSPEDRRKFLRGLDDTESVLLIFYKYLLYLLIPSVTLLAALFFRSVSNDSFRDFLRIYGGILYLIFLAWAVGQLFAIRNRQSRGPSGWNTPSPGDPKIKVKFSKDPETGARGFSFNFGFGTPGSSSSTKTMRIGLSASSVAEEDKLDDAALVQADAYVTAGSGLDMICRLLNPRYKDWSSPQQQVYRAYLENQLELRRMAASQVDETLASAPASETHAVQIPPPETTSSHFPEAETPKSRQSLFALPPIVWFFLISFVIMVTACLVGLYFFSRARSSNPRGTVLAFQKITRIRSKLAAVGCVSLLAVVGCSRPKQYRLGEAIPVGSYTLSISMTEMTHQLHQRQLVIFYRCNGAGWTSLSQSEREEFVSSCRSPRFTLLDGGENEYAPEEVELATMYRADRTAYQEAYTNDEDSRVINPSVESKNKKEADKWAEAALYGPPEQWVIVFDVPENAAKFTLELKPSFFGSSASIALDR